MVSQCNAHRSDQWLTTTGDVPLRREVHDLRDNYPDQWNLYILALEAMQMTDPEDESSYYAVAGRNIET